MLQYEFFKVMRIVVILFFYLFVSKDSMSQIKKEKTDILNSKISNVKKTTSKSSPTPTSPIIKAKGIIKPILSSSNPIAKINNTSPVAKTETDIYLVQLPIDSVVIKLMSTDKENQKSLEDQWAIRKEPISSKSYVLLTKDDNLIVKDLIEGEYLIELTVSDGKLSSKTNIKIYVLKESLSPPPIVIIEGPVSDRHEQKDYNFHSITGLENKSNNPPTVKILDSNKTVQLPTSSTSFSATANDEDGWITLYKWEKLSGKNCIITGENSSTLYISDLSEGSYSFKLTVTDNKGGITTSYANIIVKSAVPQIISSPTIITKNEQPQKLKGGAGNALLNLFLPGVGHFFVSGDHHGNHKKAGSFLITVGYLASAGLGVYYKLKSNTAYNSYLDFANNKEYQRDASGNVIGIRSPSEAAAAGLFNDAKSNNNNFKILLMVSGGILASDFIYTLIKGSKNKHNNNKEYSTKVSFNYNGISKQFSPGIVINF